jgi:3-oxoacyl-[acyl-carrier-protein] synthase III
MPDAMAPRNVRIAGTGIFLPEHRVTSEELDDTLGKPRGWSARATGVTERRYARHETTEQMAAAAARRALADAGLAPEDLDLVIAASAAPRQQIPCTAVFVQRALGLPDAGSVCFDINATCLSWLVALDVASNFVASGRSRAALIVTSELASCFLNPQEPESAALFGDAAVATIVTASGAGSASRIGHVRFETHSSGAELAEFVGGGTRHSPNHPDTRPEMNMFHMQGRALLKMAWRILPPFLDNFFREACTERSSYDVVVPHQASGPGVESLVDTFGFAAPQVVSNLATRGNCVAASIPLAFAEAIHSGRISRGDRVLLLGVGAGVTMGAMDLVY